MKNCILSFVFFLTISLFANNGNLKKENLLKNEIKQSVLNDNKLVNNFTDVKNSKTIENKAELEKDDAIRCKVTESYGYNSVTLSCWFCNCDSLRLDALALLLEIIE